MITCGSGIEIRDLDPSVEASLAELFTALRDNGDEPFFHPHPLTSEEARVRCRDGGDDVFVAAVCDGRVVAYGMLRGWAAGYDIPSLGIAVHPDHRGTGLARRMMDHLHHVAAARGTDRVRLKVHHQNDRARRLYDSLGYEITGREGDELVLHFDVAKREELSP